MVRLVFACGALLGALGVMAGAFGAHALKARLEPRALEIFELAVRYQMIHALALLAVALASLRWPAAIGASWFFAGGVLVFCGTLYALALGAPKWFGAITPLGGLALIVGWLWLAWAALRGA